MAKLRIELDCGDMPPDCGFECGACIQEIKEALEAIDGVSGFSQDLEGHVQISMAPEKIREQQILDVISGLPAGQEGFFEPKLRRDQRTRRGSD